MNTTRPARTDPMIDACIAQRGPFSNAFGARRRASTRVSTRTVKLVSAGAALSMVLSACTNDPGQSVILSSSAVAADSHPDAQPSNAGGSGSTTGDASPVVTDSIPEVGTPGLDSTDAFCAGWSAWAGSQQVIAVAANFSDPASVPSLEVAAAPTFVSAHDAMFANWPSEIDASRDLADKQYFGPMYNRATQALAALKQAGADQPTIELIQTNWVKALETRDPTTPEFSVDLPPPVWTQVDAAAKEFSAKVPAFLSDESLTITANTDPIDSYIGRTCPDRGILGGLDATAGAPGVVSGGDTFNDSFTESATDAANAG